MERPDEAFVRTNDECQHARIARQDNPMAGCVLINGAPRQDPRSGVESRPRRTQTRRRCTSSSLRKRASPASPRRNSDDPTMNPNATATTSRCLLRGLIFGTAATEPRPMGAAVTACPQCAQKRPTGSSCAPHSTQNRRAITERLRSRQFSIYPFSLSRTHKLCARLPAEGHNDRRPRIAR